MLRVKKTNRIGYRPGCWKISKPQAKKLCKDTTLPRVGYEVTVLETTIYHSNGKGTMFPRPGRILVSNRADQFVVTDESNLLCNFIGITEINDTNPRF